MTCSVIAATRAIWLGARYAAQFHVKPSELGRYFLKCLNLGLCYGGFIPSFDFRKATRAGDVAFLCCAYDVATDWRSFGTEPRLILEAVLRRHAPEWASVLTMELYSKEVDCTIGVDGLERGALALEFAVGVIGLNSHFTPAEVRETGMLLQIVDDVLDFEEDRARGELNCLTTPRSGVYLTRLAQGLDTLRDRFGKSLIMKLVLGKVESLMRERFVSANWTYADSVDSEVGHALTESQS